MGSTNHLAYLMATKLKLDVSEIRQPLDNRWSSKPYDTDTPASRLWNGFPAALVVVGVLVFLLALGGIVYICASWDRYVESDPFPGWELHWFSTDFLVGCKARPTNVCSRMWYFRHIILLLLTLIQKNMKPR